MTTYFISRHVGAMEWALQQGVRVDKLQTHLELGDVHNGDTVIGSLPVNMVAELTAKQVNYFHLSMDLPEHLRGRELSMQEMQACRARLEQYRAEKID